jgi:hypothetical protein
LHTALKVSRNVGKTVSARQYSHWSQVESLMGGPPPYRYSAMPPRDSGPWRTVLYTPRVTNAPRTLEHAVGNLWRTVDGLAARATLYGDPGAAVVRQPADLLVVDLCRLGDYADLCERSGR